MAATNHSITINVGTPAAAVDFIQVGTSVFETQDRLTKTGVGYGALVDVGLGQLGVSLDSSAHTNVYTGGGASSHYVVFTNNSATTPVVLAAGDLHLEVNDLYNVVDGGALEVQVQLDALIGGSPASARARVTHSVTGTQPAQSIATKLELDGGTAVINQADELALNVSLRMPQLTIPAGGAMTVSYLLLANSASGGDSMDFPSNPAKVCLRASTLVLGNNLAVPMNWCNL